MPLECWRVDDEKAVCYVGSVSGGKLEPEIWILESPACGCWRESHKGMCSISEIVLGSESRLLGLHSQEQGIGRGGRTYSRGRKSVESENPTEENP